MASMAVARVGVGVATLNSNLYAVGGHDGRSYLNTVEVIPPNKQPIRTRYLGHVAGYQPIRDHDSRSYLNTVEVMFVCVGHVDT